MSGQPEMFPITEEERITLLRKNLQSDLDKRLAKRDAAAVMLADAQESEDLARGLLAVFDSMVRERAAQRGKSHSKTIMQEAADVVNSGALDTDGVTVTASVTPAMNRRTGEVPPANPPSVTPAVDPVTGDGFGVDPITPPPGVDPITGEVAPAVVLAFYPGDDADCLPHETQAGDRTRYSELVADYFTAAGLNDDVDADEWTVVARRELTQDGDGYRSLHDVIAPADYGQELLVVAADQGSVTGAPAENVTP